MVYTKNQKWFNPVRSSYLPASAIGFTIYFAYLIYLIALLIGWVIKGHHIWNFLVNVIPLSVGAAIITQYIASKHSK